MAKGKKKPDEKITQLRLFAEEQPAETAEVEVQAEVKHTEQPAEVTPPKNEKIKNPKLRKPALKYLHLISTETR